MNTESYRARLEAEKAELVVSLQTVGRINPANPGDWEPLPQETGRETDPVDQADLIEGYEDNTDIMKDLEVSYNEVHEALGRIDEGAYGICDVCGSPISEERLEANPAASTCMAHAK
ncbi:MAG: TraR/DksA C4-type zinc finger protein [Patescibacteria group bacterium]